MNTKKSKMTIIKKVISIPVLLSLSDYLYRKHMPET